MRELDVGILFSIPPSLTIGKSQGIRCALDNGAYPAHCKGYGFNEYAFLKGIDYCLSRKIQLDFIVCPDIVAGGLKSADFSMAWRARLPGFDNLYFVAQDGMDDDCIRACVSGFAGLFVGGSMDWKIRVASGLRRLATELGKPMHIGRIGELHKLLWAHQEIGADSVDSTNFVRNGRFDVVEQFRAITGGAAKQRQWELFERRPA